MHRVLLVMPLFAIALAHAQTMTEVGASAAGSAIGSAAGKKVSDGITSIFGKVDATTTKAAKSPPVEDPSKAAPLLEVGPGALKPHAALKESVPPPPPVRRASAARSASVEAMPEILPLAPPPPPAPPQVTAADLKKISSGMRREDLLKLGTPVSRIIMADDGHLLETFSYAEKEVSLGRVRLTDGVVSSVEIRQN